MELSTPKIRKVLIVFGLNSQDFSIKYFLYFFLKRPAFKKFLILSQKKAFLILRKRNFLFYLEKVFSRKVYFRTLAYLLEAYSDQNRRHIQNIVKYLKRLKHCQTFCKNLQTFSPSSKNKSCYIFLLHFRK